jgi:Na+/H+-dicarboxylate symporter
MKKKFPLHLKILIGMLLGVIFGVLMMNVGNPDQVLVDEANMHKELVEGLEKQKINLNSEIASLNDIIRTGENQTSELAEREKLLLQLKNVDVEIVKIIGKTSVPMSWGKKFIMNWIKPWGTIFVNLLKLIAIPLIVASLLKGISDLKDISKFKKIGGRSILIYVGTTIVAITIGLMIVNVVEPGSGISDETVKQMTETYSGNSNIQGKISTAAKQVESGPLDFLVDMVPNNIMNAMSDNGSMLKVIFFIIFFGIAMLLIPEEKAKPIKDFFDGLNDVVLKMVDLIMIGAP